MGDADKTLRRGAAGSAGATQEIAAQDILEIHPIVARSALRSDETDLNEIPVDIAPFDPPSVEVKSVSAMEIDVGSRSRRTQPPRRRADSTFQINAIRPARRQLGAVVTSAMIVSLVILTGAAIRARIAATGGVASDSPSSALASQVVVPTSMAVPLPMAATAPASQVSQASLPRPLPQTPAPASTDSSASTTGTVMAAPRVRPLYIDGVRITAQSAMVTCGQHLVRAGWGKARTVTVPCGQTLYVERGGKTSVR